MRTQAAEASRMSAFSTTSASLTQPVLESALIEAPPSVPQEYEPGLVPQEVYGREGTVSPVSHHRRPP
jgi:hypothetical protein